MGTWGYRVLQNDYVLDELYDYFAGTTNYNVELFVNHLFASKLDSDPNSNDRKLLGVAIVDASINGCDRNLLGLDYCTLDRYVIFFEWLALHPLHNLIPAALTAIDTCIANGVDSWSEQSREDRMNLYHTYKNRLSQS